MFISRQQKVARYFQLWGVVHLRAVAKDATPIPRRVLARCSSRQSLHLRVREAPLASLGNLGSIENKQQWRPLRPFLNTSTRTVSRFCLSLTVNWGRNWAKLLAHGHVIPLWSAKTRSDPAWIGECRKTSMVGRDVWKSHHFQTGTSVRPHS